MILADNFWNVLQQTAKGLSKNQYGFKKGKLMLTAIKMLVNTAKEAI